MQTSTRMTAISVFKQVLQRLPRRTGLDQVLAQLAQDDLVAEQLRRLIVDQQNVDLSAAVA